MKNDQVDNHTRIDRIETHTAARAGYTYMRRGR